MIRRAGKEDINTLVDMWSKMANGIMGSKEDECNISEDIYDELYSLLTHKDIHFVLFEHNKRIKGFFLGWIQERDFYFFKEDYCYIFNHFIEESIENVDFGELLHYFENLALHHKVNSVHFELYKNADMPASILEFHGYKNYRTRFKKNVEDRDLSDCKKGKLVFNKAGIEDVNKIETLWNELVDSQMNDNFFGKEAKNAVLKNSTYQKNIQNGYVEIARNEAGYIGFIEAEVRNKDVHFMVDDYIYIVNQYLKPGFRSYQAAAVMLFGVEKWANKRGFRYICADIFGHNDRVAKCIKHFGYKPFKVRYIKQVSTSR